MYMHLVYVVTDKSMCIRTVSTESLWPHTYIKEIEADKSFDKKKNYFKKGRFLGLLKKGFCQLQAEVYTLGTG